MIDKNKRTTLKGIAAVAGTVATVAIPSFNHAYSLSDNIAGKRVNPVRQVWPPIAVRSPIEVSTRMTTEKNDIEVVLTNKSKQSVTMTQITPESLNTLRGNFQLDEILSNGPRQLVAGESVCVASRRSKNSCPNSQQQLRNSGLSISTSANEFCAISYAIVA